MAEEERGKRKPVEEIFKDAFKPGKKIEKGEAEEIPASEIFKDIFKPGRVGERIGVPEGEKVEVREERAKEKVNKMMEEKPISEKFKDIFKPGGVGEK
ncbi:MAG TPA: hypothetical protein ENG12_01505, partial [Candidatus Altiarchaeales archaeon]|nr:hypothetical protein [Candidatus Altiarchaeales archaeon]